MAVAAESNSDTSLSSTIKALSGVDLVLCSRIGTTPEEALNDANIQVSTDYAYHGVDATLANIFAPFSKLAEKKWQKQSQKQPEAVV
ncbi:NifB/NifX family molybdenum-iron cluster-binding protein [Psychromonas sp. KJ10-10]|uniref:NifB/NifX family molybdenum-iron cluster-binding protein n=1 Tax=Psychromonas sp. KJ10-10 TaxID=3391823 RepID=UPI0039B4DF42